MQLWQLLCANNERPYEAAATGQYKRKTVTHRLGKLSQKWEPQKPEREDGLKRDQDGSTCKNTETTRSVSTRGKPSAVQASLLVPGAVYMNANF